MLIWGLGRGDYFFCFSSCGNGWFSGLRHGSGRAIALALQSQAVGAVSEPVEGSGAEQSVGEGVAPLREVEVGGDYVELRVMGLAARTGIEGESRELSDVCQRVGRDGVQGQGLAPGVGADGDAVVDGGAEELLETVVGFEVEGGGLVVAEQQSLLHEGAGDAGGDGAEQALEFGLCRGGATVEAGPFLFERVDAIHQEHVQVLLRFSAEPKRWMRVTAPVRAPTRTRNPARWMRKVAIAR